MGFTNKEEGRKVINMELTKTKKGNQMKYTVTVTVEFEGDLEVEAEDADQARSLAESAVSELIEAQGTVFEPYRRPTETIGMMPGIEKNWQISLTAIDGRTEQE